jgi:acyl dehydratase
MLRRSCFLRNSAAAPTGRVVRVGDKHVVRRVFTREDVKSFAALSGDDNPIHQSDAAAKAAGFDRAIVHGQLVGSLFSYIMGVHLPGKGSIYVSQQVQFCAPVLVDEEVEASITIQAFRKDKGLVDAVTEVRRVRDGVVAIKGRSIGLNRLVDYQGETPEMKR